MAQGTDLIGTIVIHDDLKTVKVRHEGARRRTLTVANKQFMAQNYLSIRFDCEDFGDFVTASADDHVKLFIGGNRTGCSKPPMRDYTPREVDVAARSLTIDFALHPDPGPATAWAIGAKPGDRIDIGGPRGSALVSDQFASYWLIGDEAAIPSIMRRLTEWPEARVHALIAVSDASAQPPLPMSASHEVTWIHRPANEAANAGLLVAAWQRWFKPSDDCFVWIAAESGVTRALRNSLLAMSHPASRVRASGYWTMGKADTTEKFD